MANQGKGDPRSQSHAPQDRKNNDRGDPNHPPAQERPRNDPGRATDAERRSGGPDNRARHDPDRAYDAERRSDRGDPRTNNRPV